MALTVKRPLDPDIGLQFSEMSHHLRSCLDNALWRAAMDTGLDAKSVTARRAVFPWAKSEDEWRQSLRKNLPWASIELRDVVQRYQPYRVDEDSRRLLQIVRETNNADKHETLAPVAVGAIDGVAFLDLNLPAGVSYSFGMSNSDLLLDQIGTAGWVTRSWLHLPGHPSMAVARECEIDFQFLSPQRPDIHFALRTSRGVVELSHLGQAIDLVESAVIAIESTQKK